MAGAGCDTGFLGMRAVAALLSGSTRHATGDVDRFASLIAVGLIMLSLAWVPFIWVGRLLAIGGTIFIVRGPATAAILALASDSF
jgi:hypothetical protein